MTTPDAPDAPDNAHSMDAHDSPDQNAAPGTAATDPAGPAKSAGPAEPVDPAQPAGPAGPGGPTGASRSPRASDARETVDADVVAELTGPAGDLEDETAEETALRDLMRDAVRDLRPAPDALDHLRRAVPARRQHRRQALAGTAAAVLLVGTAVPALIHAAGNAGSDTAAPANVASTHPTHADKDGHANAWGSTGDAGQSDHGKDSGSPSRKSPSAGGTDGPSSTATSPGGTSPATVPDCSSDQLGQGRSNADSLDADGRVDGWFRVANVSTATCAVPPGPADVQVFSLGRTDTSQISVVSHTTGDAAPELPATADTDPVVLAPGENYEVAFAWVPADTGPGGCPQPTSPPVTPTPTDTPTETAVPDPAGADLPDNAMSGSVPNDGPTGSDTAVSLRHTPAAGAPVVFGPTLQGACAGTVYTTPPMPTASGDTPPS